MGTLSPVKSSRNNTAVKYFEGHISDGCNTVRFVSLEPKLRPQLEEAREQSSGVLLKNCAVKRSTQHNLEVQANSRTVISNSPKKFKVDKTAIQLSEVRSNEIKALEDLKDVAEHQYMSVTGKITSLFPIERIKVKSSGTELQKRDFFLSDQTGIYRCVAWESHIELLQENNSYCITNATVRSFNGEKYVSIGQQCEITMIQDIGQVIDSENPEGSSGRAKVIKAEIVTVITIDIYKSCSNCFAKVPPTESLLVVCQKCNAKMKLAKMKLAKCPHQSVANVILEDDTKKLHRVTVFNDVLQQIRSFGEQMMDGT